MKTTPLRVAHLSDSHWRSENLQEIKDCHDFIIFRLTRWKPDIICHTGDVFDSRDVRAGSDAALAAADRIRKLSDIAPVVVLRGTISHDGTAPQLLASCAGKNQVVIVDTPQQLLLVEMVDGRRRLYPAAPPRGEAYPTTYESAHYLAMVTAFPAPTKEFYKSMDGILNTDAEIADIISEHMVLCGAVAVDYDCPQLLMGHWNTTGAFVTGSERLTGVDIEISADQMRSCSADLVMLGHIHKRQIIGSNIFYAGSTQPLNWGELDPKGFWLHTIDSPSYNVKSESVDTPTERRIRFKIDVTDPEWFEPFLRVYDALDYLGAIIRIDYAVYVDQAKEFEATTAAKHRAFFLENCGSKEVIVNIQGIPRAVTRGSAIKEAQRLRDKLLLRAEIVEETVAPEVLDYADKLDDMTADEIINAVTEKLEGLCNAEAE